MKLLISKDQLDHISSVSSCQQRNPLITKHEKPLIHWLIDEEVFLPECRPLAVTNHQFQWLI